MELSAFGTQIITVSPLDALLNSTSLEVQVVCSPSVQSLQMRSSLVAGLMEESEPTELTIVSCYGKLRTLIKAESLPSVYLRTPGSLFQEVCLVKLEFGKSDQESSFHT